MAPNLFRYRDFRLYQCARFLLTIAIQMQSVAVAWQVYDLTRRPLALGYVGLAQFLPMVCLSPLTGAAADRFDRRRVVMVTNLGIATSAVLLLTSALMHVEHAYFIYAILAFFGTVRAFSGPAASALVTHLVPMEEFPRSVAWSSTVWQIATVLGPALGGVVYGLFGGPAGVYAISALLATAAFAGVFALKVRTGRMEGRATSLATLSAGVRYVFSQKLLLGSITLDLFAVLLGGAVALLPIFARDILHTGPWGLGLLRSAPALGASMMAIWLAFHPLRQKVGLLMFACVGLYGVATIVFALSQTYLLSLAALVVAGASDMVSVVVRGTLVQIATPPAMRGRVSAVNQVFVGASNELGEFESGLTAALFGTVRAAVLGGVATCAVVLTCMKLFPALRNVDRIDQVPQGNG
ncbi:MFS transporter [Pendulispora brunnea]|uniref:MFS transporter n=1 Tax=Pendulispora brunnea TaxID=2905690 RepID=A0ABZ2KJ44_9BACT